MVPGGVGHASHEVPRGLLDIEAVVGDVEGGRQQIAVGGRVLRAELVRRLPAVLADDLGRGRDRPLRGVPLAGLPVEHGADQDLNALAVALDAGPFLGAT
eukprot:4738096-Pyramimonas_sp.AAC.1